jgi:hypothetical protein
MHNALVNISENTSAQSVAARRSGSEDDRKSFGFMNKNGVADKLQCGTKSKQIDRNKANNKQEQAMPFVKGQSGNPRGRPVGARGKKTLAREAALRAEADAKASRMIHGALGTRGRRALPRLPRVEKQSPPARPPAHAVPRDPWTEAAALATLLGVDAATVREAIELSGGGGALSQFLPDES